MRFQVLLSCLTFVIAISSVGQLFAQHRVLLQGKNKLAIVDTEGQIEWEMPWGGIHDLHVLPNGNFMAQQQMKKVVEIDPEKKEVVWEYDSSTQNGNAGKRVEVHAFQPLANGNVMIVESGPARIIEVNRDGEIQKEIKLVVDHPNPHTDTRLVRKLDNGNYLACHEADGTVREYDADGKVVWAYTVPMFGKAPRGGHGLGAFGNKLFSALRLENGNTLIGSGNGHSVLEVTSDKRIVWQVHQNDLPGIQLAWVTTLEVLANGHYLIGNCHAGPRNPLLIEVDPKTKEVVWTLDQYDVFGNSVPNSRVLPPKAGANKVSAKLSIGDVAPPVVVSNWVQGKQFDAFESDKVYVVEFWATWCGPCLQSMPHMSELQEKYADQVHFVGITREDEKTVSKFLARSKSDDETWSDVIGYSLAIDDGDRTDEAYMTAAEQNGIPAAFIVGKDGVLEWIGHPMSIDSPLASVVAGTWDRDAAILRQELIPRIGMAVQRDEWDEALRLVNRLDDADPNDLTTNKMKLIILQRLGKQDELRDLRAEMVTAFWEDSLALNDVAWNIASAEGAGKADLAIALKAAKQSSKLTDNADGSILDTLARVYYESGDLDAAIANQQLAHTAESGIRQIEETLEKYLEEKEAAK